MKPFSFPFSVLGALLLTAVAVEPAMAHREYMAGLQRFVQRDPLGLSLNKSVRSRVGDAQSGSTYLVVNSRPTRLVDPLGLIPVPSGPDWPGCYPIGDGWFLCINPIWGGPGGQYQSPWRPAYEPWPPPDLVLDTTTPIGPTPGPCLAPPGGLCGHTWNYTTCQFEPNDPCSAQGPCECEMPPQHPVPCSVYPEGHLFCGADARCVCLCMGDDPWSNYVRHCLACKFIAGCDDLDSHRDCYSRADQLHPRPDPRKLRRCAADCMRELPSDDCLGF